MKFPFPYEYRDHQKEAVKFIYKSIEDEGFVCLDAPTGFGKTPVILASLLKRGRRIIWAVRTGNETDRPIEELKIINDKLGEDYFGLSFRGKKDMCLLARKKFRGKGEHEEIAYLCKSERKNCPYYRNLQNFYYFPDSPLLYSEIMEIGEENEICPYFYQRFLAQAADVISFNYNYILNENLMWSFRSIIDFRDSYLVVDEAHNLQFAYSSIYGDKITLGTIKNALRESEKHREIYKIVLKIAEDVEKLKNNIAKERKREDVFSPSEIFSTNFQELEKLLKYGESIRKKLLKEGKRPRSSSYRLANFLIDCLEKEGTRGVEFIGRRLPKNFELEIYDMRAKEVLSHIWKKFRGVVFCSGTLRPIDAFADVVGIDNFAYRSFPPPYKEENIRTYLIRGLSTRGDKLPGEMAERYIYAIKQIARIGKNTAVFCASHRILNSLIRRGLASELRDMGKEVFIEKKGMSGHRARKILEEFRKTDGGILLATASGRFSEGADYPGRSLEVVFMAGIPFERVTLKTSLYIQYYKEIYGEERGEFYSYVVPALRRASQALGRVLRSEEDTGIFFLGDERYINYRALLPEYIVARMKIISLGKIRRVVNYLRNSETP